MLHRLCLGALLAPALLLTGCGWTSDLMKGDKVDYVSQAKANSNAPPTLEVPPDLTKVKPSDRFTIPGEEKPRIVKASDEAGKPTSAASGATDVVLPPVSKDMHIERGGSQRWLVVNGKPDQYWDTIKQFWQEGGFVITTEQPDIGVMETDWAEKRAKLSTNVVGRVIGSVFDNFTATPERDKFRTRLEVNSLGQTEIYISHRGLVEVYVNEGRDQTAWQPRPSDPELEAEFLRRLMVRLGSDGNIAQKLIAGSTDPAADANGPKIVKPGQYSMLMVPDEFDRAWRRVGLALDRVGFTVEDRDRSKGLFYVRYADPEVAAKKEPQSWWNPMRIFNSKEDAVKAEQFQIKVSSADPATQVAVLSKTGAPEESQTSRRILSLLQQDLK